MFRTKKSHLAVAFFLRSRITTWLARKRLEQQQEPKRPSLERKQQELEQQRELVRRQRGLLLEQEFQQACCKRPRQRQR